MIDLKIYNDYNAVNPRKARDCEPPLITKWGRDFWDNEYWIDILKFIRSKLNKKNMYKIADVLWYSREDIEKEKSYYSDKKSIEVIDDYLYNELENIDDIENILDILKVKNYKRVSRWYCQWDVVDCILIATDTRIKDTGIKNKDVQQSLVDSAKLYDARAWWDVYRYRLVKYNELYNKDWELSKQTEEEIIDSCWWFYWDDWLQQIFEDTKSYWITEEIFEKAKENIIQ